MPLWDISQREDLKIAVIGRMVVEIAANQAKFQRDLGKMQGNVSRFTKTASKSFKMLGGIMGVSLGAAGMIAGFKSIISKTAGVGDQFHKMSLRTGIATERLSALGYAAQISGTNIEVVEKSLRYASNIMLDFSQGVGEAKKTLEALGLTVTDSQGKLKNTADFLVEVADKFKDMTDETKMAAYASELFGARAGTQLLPLLKLGSKGIEDLTKKAKELGIVITTEGAEKAAEYTDRMADLTGAFGGLKRTIGFELLPVMTVYAERMTQWVVANRELIAQRLPEYIDSLGSSVKTISWWLEAVARHADNIARAWELVRKLKGIPALPPPPEAQLPSARGEIINREMIIVKERIKEATDAILNLGAVTQAEMDMWVEGSIQLDALQEKKVQYFNEEMELRGELYELQMQLGESALQADLKRIAAQDAAALAQRHNEERIEFEKYNLKLGYMQAGMNLVKALGAFQKKEGKAMFIVTKGLEVAMAIMHAHQAAIGAAAAVAHISIVGPALAAQQYSQWLAIGYANAAAIAATAIGQMVMGGAGGAGGIPATSATEPLTPTGLYVEEPEKRGALTIIIEGDILAEDYYIDKLADKINKAVEDRDVRLISTHSKYAEQLI